MGCALTTAACVAALLMAVGVDRRDAVTLGLYALAEDVVMAGNLIAIVALLVGVAVVWWRGRVERRRLAEAFERARRDEAQRAADEAVADARRRAERDRARPAADVLQDFARRGGRR